MNYSNPVTLHDYYSSFIHYFSICFSLLSTLSGSQLSLSTVYSLLTLTSLSFHHSLSPSISPQSTDLTHHQYDLNRQTTPWRSLNGTISLARDLETTLWWSSQGCDVWVLMGIDPVDGGWDFDGWVEYFDRWVLILIGLFFLVHWWVLMILSPIGWVMILLDWVSSWVGD